MQGYPSYARCPLSSLALRAGNLNAITIHPLRIPPIMPTRREKIEAMLADDPTDSFLRYSLALELQKENEHDRCLTMLRELMHDQPPQVAAFFRTGQLLASLDRIDEARAALRDGIEAARTQGDSHAAGEMSEFLASLGALGE